MIRTRRTTFTGRDGARRARAREALTDRQAERGNALVGLERPRHRDRLELARHRAAEEAVERRLRGFVPAGEPDKPGVRQDRRRRRQRPGAGCRSSAAILIRRVALRSAPPAHASRLTTDARERSGRRRGLTMIMNG
jgi:hypothetical protein